MRLVSENGNGWRKSSDGSRLVAYGLELLRDVSKPCDDSHAKLSSPNHLLTYSVGVDVISVKAVFQGLQESIVNTLGDL